MDAAVTPRRSVRRSYAIVVAWLFALVILVGFSRTYYLKLTFGTPALTSLLHVHGLVMSLWVAAFASQVWLVATRRLRWHRTLGYASIGLAAAIVLTGVPTAIHAGAHGSPSFPPGIPPRGFMIVPLGDLVMFVLFFGGAIYWRKRPDRHRPLMLLTALNFMPPGLARLPLPALQALGPAFFFGVPTAVAVACLVAGARSDGRVNRVLAVGSALLVASYVARLALMTTPGWLAVATWLTSSA